MIPRTRIDLVLALLATLAPPALSATPPERINYQGVLRDTADVPQDGTRDMQFAFYDDADEDCGDGTLLLTDSHLAAGAGDVEVTRGLFSVGLGGGSIAAGAESSLADVFRNHASVFLEVRIEPPGGGALETLCPRIRVLTTGYALNARSVEGLGGEQLLRSDASDSFTAGTLTFDPATTVDVAGALRLAGAPVTASADELNRLDGVVPSVTAFNLSILTAGAVADGLHFHSSVPNATNASTLDGIDSLSFLRSDTSDTFADLTGNNLTLQTTLEVGNEIHVDGPLLMNTDGPDTDQRIFFYDNGVVADESFGWGESNDQFELSDDLALTGRLAVGSLVNSVSVPYNRIGSIGLPDTGAAVNSGSDLYVAEDVEIDQGLYLNGALQLDDDGPDGSQHLYFYDGGSPTGKRFSWNNALESFELTGRLAINDPVLEVGAGQPSATLDFDGSIIEWVDAFDYFTVYDEMRVLAGSGTGVVNLAENNYGVHAEGSFPSAAGWFDDPSHTGDAKLAIGDTGILAVGSFQGGEFADTNSGSLARVGYDTHKITGTGSMGFIQNHPDDPTRVVVYNAPEGDEVAVYTRGTAQLSGGEARVALGETFALVANPDIGLTVHLTPRDGWAPLSVASLGTSELVVRSEDPATADARFDYMVWGLRIGFEEVAVVQHKTREAYIPSMQSHRDLYARRPELRAQNALERFKVMASAAGESGEPDLGRARALREAIHEFDPARDALPASDPVGDGTPRRAPEAASPSLEHAVAGRPGSGVAEAGGVPPSQRPAPLQTSVVAVLPTTGPVREGDVVVLDPTWPGAARASEALEDPGVVGCAVPVPAGVELVPGSAAVATSGIVACRVDALSGAIAVGDLLTTSPNPGHAMRASDPAPGTVVGKAVEALESGTGLIRVLVTLR